MFVVVGIQADGCFSFNFPQLDSICPTSFRRHGVVPEGLHRMPRHGRKHPAASELLRRNPCVEQWSTDPLYMFWLSFVLNMLVDNAREPLFSWRISRGNCHMQTEECACSHCSLYWRNGGKPAGMESPQRRNCIASHTTGRGGCRWVQPPEVTIFVFFSY